jgi:hypothetical protein
MIVGTLAACIILVAGFFDFGRPTHPCGLCPLDSDHSCRLA